MNKAEKFLEEKKGFESEINNSIQHLKVNYPKVIFSIVKKKDSEEYQIVSAMDVSDPDNKQLVCELFKIYEQKA